MNKVQHFQMPVDNMERAKRFYQEIFGWEITPVPGMGSDYHTATTVPVDEKGQPKVPGGINGALFQRGTHSQEGISIVINVPSIDKYLKKIKAAGSKVVMPQSPVGDFGLYAQITDTEGNVIGIWEDVKPALKKK